VAPELLVLGQIRELLFDRGHPVAPCAGPAKLPDRVDCKVPELDPLRLP
jgi:hypothetical protein